MSQIIIKSFRYWIVSCILLQFGSASAQYSVEGLLLVTHNENAMVTFVDLQSGVVVDSIHVEEGPYEVAVSPNGDRAVVTHYGRSDFGSTLSIIDVQNRLLERTIQLPAFSRPHGIAFLPDPHKVIVTLEEYDSFAIVNVETGEVEKTVETGQLVGHNLAVDIEHNRAYIVNMGSKTVTIIDLLSYEIVKHIQIGTALTDIVVSPSGLEIWVTDRSENTISVISTTSHEIVETLPAGFYPTRIRFAPNGKYALVCLPRWGEVMIFDTEKKEYLQSIIPDWEKEKYEVKDKIHIDSYGVEYKDNDSANRKIRVELIEKGKLPMPTNIAITPNGDFAFITSKQSDYITVLQLMSEDNSIPAIAAFIPVESDANGIAFSPLNIDTGIFVPNTIVLAESREKAVSIDGLPDESNFWEGIRPQTKYFEEIERSNQDEFVKEYETPFRIILDEDELNSFDSLLSHIERKVFIENYWRSNDPNPLYDVNYSLLEYISRLSYVKKNFASKNSPFIDDRGKTYLKYGNWRFRYQDQGGVRDQRFLSSNIKMYRDFFGPTGAAPSQKPLLSFMVFPNESWSYIINGQEFTVHFVKEGAAFKEVASLDMALPQRRSTNRVWHWMDLVKDRLDISTNLAEAVNSIESFENNFLNMIGNNSEARGSENINFDRPHSIVDEKKIEIEVKEGFLKQVLSPVLLDRVSKMNQIAFDTRITQFKGRNGLTRLDVLFLTDVDTFLKQRNDEGASDNIIIDYASMIRDSSYNTIEKVEQTGIFPQENAKAAGLNKMVEKSSFEAFAQKAELTTQVKDKSHNIRGFRKDEIEIRDFTGTKLMISDLQFYSPVLSAEQYNLVPVETIDELDITPYPHKVILSGEPVLVYFEQYNLIESGISGKYNIDISVVASENSGGIRNLLGRKNEFALSISQERNITSNDQNELISLDFSDVKSGDYMLIVTIRDLQNDTNRVTATRFIKVKN